MDLVRRGKKAERIHEPYNTSGSFPLSLFVAKIFRKHLECHIPSKIGLTLSFIILYAATVRKDTIVKFSMMPFCFGLGMDTV